MGVRVDIRFSDLYGQPGSLSVVVNEETEWSTFEQTLKVIYSEDCSLELDTRYWDGEDQVIISSQEEFKEALRLAAGNVFEEDRRLILHVKPLDPDRCSPLEWILASSEERLPMEKQLAESLSPPSDKMEKAGSPEQATGVVEKVRESSRQEPCQTAEDDTSPDWEYLVVPPSDTGAVHACEQSMVPGAASGANVIAIDIPECASLSEAENLAEKIPDQHHGTETAEPAEMAETGEVSTKSGRDAETGFWMLPKAEKPDSSSCSSNSPREIEKELRPKKTAPHGVCTKDGRAQTDNTGNQVQNEDQHLQEAPVTLAVLEHHMKMLEEKVKKDVKKIVAKELKKDLPTAMTKSKKTMQTFTSKLKAAKDDRHGGRQNDSAQRLETYIHDQVMCDYCGSEIVGVRYLCGNCLKFDLCEKCEDIYPPVHDKKHVFIKLRRPCPKAGFRHGERAALLRRILYDPREGKKAESKRRARLDVPVFEEWSIVESLKKTAERPVVPVTPSNTPFGASPPSESPVASCKPDLSKAESAFKDSSDPHKAVPLPLEPSFLKDYSRLTVAFENGRKALEEVAMLCEETRLKDVEGSGQQAETEMLPYKDRDCLTVDEMLSDKFELLIGGTASQPRTTSTHSEYELLAASSDLVTEAYSYNSNDRENIATPPDNTACDAPWQPVLQSMSDQRNEVESCFTPSELEVVGSRTLDSWSDIDASDDDFNVELPACFSTSTSLDATTVDEMFSRFKELVDELKKNNPSYTPGNACSGANDAAVPNRQPISLKSESDVQESIATGEEKCSDFEELSAELPTPETDTETEKKELKEDITDAHSGPEAEKVEHKVNNSESTVTECQSDNQDCPAENQEHMPQNTEHGDEDEEQPCVKPDSVPENQDLGGAATVAVIPDLGISNQLIHKVLQSTIASAGEGVHHIFRTGKEIFKSLQGDTSENDSCEVKESEYKFSPSKAEAPKSTWLPTENKYEAPKSNFQAPKSNYQLPKSSDFQVPQSNYQLPKSTYTGPQYQVVAGTDPTGEYAGPLQRLREMGYFNNEHSLALLKKFDGDVQRVVEEFCKESDEGWASRRH